MGNTKITNFVVFNTLRKHGQMNSAAAFYNEGMESTERFKLMREHKLNIASEVGFDINKIFMTLQSNQKHPYNPGTMYTLTKQDVEAHQDLYDYDVWADIVKITPETPNCVIGFNISDAPNVIVMNQKSMEAVSAFCSGQHINNKVPSMLKEVLGGNSEDMVISISPFAHKLPWMGETYEDRPLWTKDEAVWKDCLERKGSLLLINQKKAILRQLLESGLKEENIIVGEDSFYNANKYYSSQRNRMVDTFEDGRFMHAVMLQEKEEDAQSEYQQSYIKVIPTRK